MYDTLFEIEVQICQTFPALDPIRLRREKCGEVLLLLRRMIRYNRQHDQDGNRTNGSVPDDDVIVVTHKNGDVTTMRRAKDDRRW